MKTTERIISSDEIRKLMHKNAETGFIHTTYPEESLRFTYLLNGDKRAVEESVRLMRPALQGKLSDDAVRNIRYLFIINTGIATRYLIEAGIPQETVYSTSDLYIRKADLATTIDEIIELNREIWNVFVEMVNKYKNKSIYSKPVLFCLNYIDSHFNEKITLETIAEAVDLIHCYRQNLRFLFDNYQN